MALTAALIGGGVLAGCGGSSDTSSAGAGASAASSDGVKLTLVAYSTPKKAYDALTSAYSTLPQGKGVSFTQSFGASGSQSRAVDSGQPADVVAFSTTPDITRLVKDGLVASDWDANPEKGIATDSVVVLVVRKGNPKHITGWDDLIKPGVDVITPNPSTSGSARWNILAAYGAQLKEGKTPAQALAYVKTLLTKNVSVQDSSGSAARCRPSPAARATSSSRLRERRDLRGEGRRRGPVHHSQADDPDRDADRGHEQERAQGAGAGVRQLAVEPRGTDDLGPAGLPPGAGPSVAEAVRSKFPTPAAAVHDHDLGGWTAVKKQFFDPATGSITKIEQAAGVPTASS